ncbi:hypothetical protein [Pseudomonas sp.]|uniref:hypothetical protein n=1 Tax=Pseudomonas sp. TaxID=306 RepID=UPI0028A82028|nr:hypothetical protein [Pseudomonas sp.]
MEAELYTPIAGGKAGLAALAPGTPVSAIVGILYERYDIQTLNSYARLIWVCTHSPKRSALSNARKQGENATLRSFSIVPVQNVMTVIADHSCQQSTTKHAQCCIFLMRRFKAGYTATRSMKFPACLAFSALQKRQSGNLAAPPRVLPGCRFVVAARAL